ncbi:MAG: ComEC/Rec2 family competence protein [Candidatus Magasanikbacteria bacterium]|nr:ComEC/Rec2 family competence protein [Candidatus Magasanikbacteria bacterium]
MWSDKFLQFLNSKSKTFLAFCFCFIIGATAASAGDFPSKPSATLTVYGALFFLLVAVIMVWRRPAIRFAGLSTFFVLLGVWRLLITIPDCTDEHNLCSYNGRRVTLVGRISEEPDVRISEARYVVSVSMIVIPDWIPAFAGMTGRESITSSVGMKAVGGKIIIKTRLYPQYNYGDWLSLECQLQKPERRADSSFRYDKYLALGGVWAGCERPKVHPVIPTEVGIQNLDPRLHGDDNWRLGALPMKKILWLKSEVRSQIDQLWPEPESSLVAGLLYGSRSGLPPEVMENFNRTGLTHIIAVSGYNVTIIATILMSAFISIGLWRRQAFWLVLLMLALFVVFTGASASVVRAAIMGSLVLIGQHLGRLSRMGNALALAAALMTLNNPYVVLWDAGFQLSFLSTMGLVYVSPILQSVIAKILERRAAGDEVAVPRRSGSITSAVRWGIASLGRLLNGLARGDRLAFLRESLLSTLSAIIATTPLILYQFGRFSLVAPLVNILVLWTIPWLMLGGALAASISWLFFPAGQLAAATTALGLKYVLGVIAWFGAWRGAAAELSIPLWATVLAYGAGIVVVYRYGHPATRK